MRKVVLFNRKTEKWLKTLINKGFLINYISKKNENHKKKWVCVCTHALNNKIIELHNIVLINKK
jgi:hypothetical protein